MKNLTEKKKTKIINYSLLVIICFCWGWADNLAKNGLFYFSTTEVGILRIFTASILFMPIAIYNFSDFRVRKLHIYVLVSFFGTVMPAFLYAQSQMKLDSWVSAMANAVGPVFTVILSKLILKYKLKKSEIIGTIIGWVGVIVFGWGLIHSVKGHAIFVIFPIFAALSYSFSAIILAKYAQDINTVSLTSFGLSSYFLIMGFLLFFKTDFLYKLQNLEGAYKGLAYVVGVAFFSTSVAFLCFNLLTIRVSPIFASSSKLISPIISLFISVLNKEKMNFIQLIGVAIIMTSVYFIIYKQKIKNNSMSVEVK